MLVWSLLLSACVCVCARGRRTRARPERGPARNILASSFELRPRESLQRPTNTHTPDDLFLRINVEEKKAS